MDNSIHYCIRISIFKDEAPYFINLSVGGNPMATVLTGSGQIKINQDLKRQSKQPLILYERTRTNQKVYYQPA
jgi:hypothetical protein